MDNSKRSPWQQGLLIQKLSALGLTSISTRHQLSASSITPPEHIIARASFQTP
jgi:hypothetical protein